MMIGFAAVRRCLLISLLIRLLFWGLDRKLLVWDSNPCTIARKDITDTKLYATE